MLKNVLYLCAAAALGGVFVWALERRAPVVETSAQAVTQSDGSQVLQRAPDAKAKPKHAVPKGGTVERVASVTIQPRSESCGPVTCDLSLVRMDDGTRRVVASSPDGTVVGGVDVPVESAAPPPEPKPWAAGMSYSPDKQTAGVWIDRDIWRIRVGLEVNQVRPAITSPSDIEARLKVGITF